MDERLRLVVADDWAERGRESARALEEAGFSVLACAGSLTECYEYAVTFPVDAVVASPLLSQREGQAFLALLAPVTALFRPALVSVQGEYPRLTAAFEYWADTGTQSLPDLDAAAGVIRRVAGERRAKRSLTVTVRDVNCFLKCLGFRRDISGYAAARYALTGLEDGFLAKELYADMAVRLRTSPVNVERTLRFAVSSAVDAVGERMWKLVTGTGDHSNFKAIMGMRAALERFRRP